MKRTAITLLAAMMVSHAALANEENSTNAAENPNAPQVAAEVESATGVAAGAQAASVASIGGIAATSVAAGVALVVLGVALSDTGGGDSAVPVTTVEGE